MILAIIQSRKESLELFSGIGKRLCSISIRNKKRCAEKKMLNIYFIHR